MFELFSKQQILFLCGLASAALLTAAFGFEYLGGLAPCKLCLWQRWPHAGVIVFCLMGTTGVLRSRPAFLMIALCAGVTAIIAIYHVGVEQQLWPLVLLGASMKPPAALHQRYESFKATRLT